jgi:hypothetical protein
LEVQELAAPYQGRVDAAQIKQIFKNWYNKDQGERASMLKDIEVFYPIFECFCHPKVEVVCLDRPCVNNA